MLTSVTYQVNWKGLDFEVSFDIKTTSRGYVILGRELPAFIVYDSLTNGLEQARLSIRSLIESIEKNWGEEGVREFIQTERARSHTIAFTIAN